MGKQLSVIKIAGKVGDVVGMKNGFGTADLAFIRKKAENVTNPQTSAQMLQRVKMLPAVLFRRQLEEVIRRAWQGKKYGGQSMREFMRYAMTESLENIPQLEKDSVLAIPGEYLISKGSLAPVQADVNLGTSMRLNIACTPGTFAPAVDQFSTLLIEQGFAKEGDQVSIVVCTRSANDSSAYPRYYIISFFVSTSNTESIATQLANAKVQLTDNNETSLHLKPLSDGYQLLGAAVVISRDGVTPLRSTARFCVNKALLTGYFGSSVLANVAESYRLSQNVARVNNNDWPYEDTPQEDSPVEGKVRISVSANPANGGTVSGGGYVDEGEQVTVNATAASEYSFDGWYNGNTRVSQSASYTFTAQTDLTLVAKFTSKAPSEDIPGEDRP